MRTCSTRDLNDDSLSSAHDSWSDISIPLTVNFIKPSISLSPVPSHVSYPKSYEATHTVATSSKPTTTVLSHILASTLVTKSLIHQPPSSTVWDMSRPTEAVPTLKRRQGIWRKPLTSYTGNEACQPITLSPGSLIVGSTTYILPAQQTDLAVFQPLCINGRPVLGTVPIPTSNNIVASHDEAWQAWISNDGKFEGSVVPLMYSIASSSAVCWLLTLVVLGFQHRRTLLYKLSLICSSIYLLVILIYSVDTLADQFASGYLDSIELRQSLGNNTHINALNLSFNLILYLGQVQTAMYLFGRQKDKRMIFWLGGSLTIIAQTIWGVSVFHAAVSQTFLPTLAYLFQISMSVLYVCCVLYFAITNHSIALHHSIVLLSFLSITAASSTIILFVVDLANVWVIEWADSISWVTTLLSIVTVREWADRVYCLQRHYEKNGVLGRQLFEDHEMKTSHDSQHLKENPKEPPPSSSSPSNSFGTRDHPGSDTSQSTRVQHEDSQSPGRRGGPHISNANVTHAIIDSPFDSYDDKSHFLRYFHKATYPVVYVSDLIINIGLSVSRPLSLNSNASKKSKSNGLVGGNILAATHSAVNPLPINGPPMREDNNPNELATIPTDSIPPLEIFIHTQRRSARSRLQSSPH